MGLDYKNPTAPYTLEQLKAANNIDQIQSDIQSGINILNNWKDKFTGSQGRPKLILINCSGGGLRATMFTMRVLQKADSLTNGNLMQHTVLMTGASGGMIAAAYYRELYYRTQTGNTLDLSSDYYLNKISGDLLNAVSISLVVNDLFYPVGKMQYNGNTFRKDRGYIFERVLHENTDSALLKPINAYRSAEAEAKIPMLLFSPTIINDERKLFIGAQKFSYLTTPVSRLQHFTPPEMDGIDIHDLLGEQHANNLLLSAAIRMNCTFPYILPNVHLPTNPSAEVMDAGLRDNFGIENSVRFAAIFADWIKENTSGVIMVNIRGLEQERPVKNKISQGVDEKIFSPIGNLYVNWVEIQDYQNDFALHYLHHLLDGNLEVITFEYQAPANRKRASLSLHLTAREKQDIISAAENT
ncbi:MAG: patatin-like phospholipase family protein, partial [Chitinophagales bacterium]